MGFEIGKVTNLYLGRVGENMARTVKIDVSEWQERWPGASIILSAIRPKETELYMPPQDVVDGMLVWPIRAEDVAIAGRGAAQIRAVEPYTNECYMARVVETRVEASLLGGVCQETEPPENDWVTKIITEVRTAQRVHVGNDMPPEHCDVWIDPQGEIDPDDYPIASEDERGCIRVGDGLQMDGDVLNVIPQESPLPENSKLFQTLVSDGVDDAHWSYRLAYDYPSTEILPETTLSFIDSYRGYPFFTDALSDVVIGKAYMVTIDNKYKFVGIARNGVYGGMPCIGFGDPYILTLAPGDAPPQESLREEAFSFAVIFPQVPSPDGTVNGIFVPMSGVPTENITISIHLCDQKKLDKRFLPDDIGGMPEGGAPYQQLVTDGEGKTVWADRLAYEDPNALTEILPETELVDTGDDGFVYTQLLGTTLVAGETYIVTYNGISYECVAVDGSTAADMIPIPGLMLLGNVGAMTGAGDSGEPFVCMVVPDAFASEMGVSVVCMPIDGATSVAVSLSKSGLLKKVDNKYLDLSDYYNKAETDEALNEALSAYLPREEAERTYEELTTIDLTSKADSGKVDVGGCKKLYLSIRSKNVRTKCSLRVQLHDDTGAYVGGGILFDILRVNTGSANTYFDKVWLYMDGGRMSFMDILPYANSTANIGLKREANLFSLDHKFTGYKTIQITTTTGAAVDADEVTIFMYGIKA